MLDASVALAWFLPAAPEQQEYADSVLERLQSDRDPAVVPLLWHEEVAHVLVTARRAKEISRAALERALGNLDALPLETHLDDHPVRFLVESALRYHVQGYDAVTFELAHRLALPLATLDKGLRSAATRHGVRLLEP